MFAGIGEIDWTDENGVHWRGSSSWPVIFVIGRYEGRTLLLIDTFRFFFGSLASVCRDLKIPQGKLERPPCIAENRAPTDEEKPYFLEYGLQDARCVREILKWLVHIWEREDVGPCISIAHQAGRLFRRNHTRIADKIRGLDATDHFGQLGGIEAYHGGRNSVTGFPEGDEPMIVEGCAMYDVRSMYPWLCSDILPPYLGGRWVWSDSPKLEGAGLYRLFGTVEKGDAWPYQLLMSPEGELLEPGDELGGTWVTGFEIESALRHNMISGHRFSGYKWEKGEDTKKRHPFREYFSWVFAEKEKARDVQPALYLYYKYLANSLTGKFVATIPQMRMEDGNLSKYRMPGALFNAPVGAAITGAGRAYLFEQELRSSSVHGATDSMVVPPWGMRPGNVGPGLGQWELVVEGLFVCGRNKLYAFLGEPKGKFTGTITAKGKKYTTEQSVPEEERKGAKKYWQGREILKYATHAFQGSVFGFLEMVFGGQRTYSYKRMVQLREASRRASLRPLQMQTFEGTLKLGGKYRR